MPRLNPVAARKFAALILGVTIVILLVASGAVIAEPKSTPVADSARYLSKSQAHGHSPARPRANPAEPGRGAPQPHPVVHKSPVPKPPVSAAPPTLEPQLPPDAGVLMLGDSLGEGTAPYLTQLLGSRPLSQEDQVGGSLYAGIGELQSRSAELPPILVISLGTNDVPTPSSFAPMVNQVLNLAGSRCVVWPDYVRPPTASYNWDQANAVLLSFAAAHQSLHVVAWSALVRAHPEWLGGDGVHVNSAGYAARAQAIAAAIARC